MEIELYNMIMNVENMKYNDIPEWKKNLCVNYICRNAKETWGFEKIVNEYSKLQMMYDKLENEYLKVMNININEIQKMNTLLKEENDSLRDEINEKNIICDKLKLENDNLINTIIALKEKINK